MLRQTKPPTSPQGRSAPPLRFSQLLFLAEVSIRRRNEPAKLPVMTLLVFPKILARGTEQSRAPGRDTLQAHRLYAKFHNPACPIVFIDELWQFRIAYTLSLPNRLAVLGNKKVNPISTGRLGSRGFKRWLRPAFWLWQWGNIRHGNAGAGTCSHVERLTPRHLSRRRSELGTTETWNVIVTISIGASLILTCLLLNAQFVNGTEYDEQLFTLRIN